MKHGESRSQRREASGTRSKRHIKARESDQAPGEENVQVNDAYAGGGPAPDSDTGANPIVEEQHQTGG